MRNGLGHGLRAIGRSLREHSFPNSQRPGMLSRPSLYQSLGLDFDQQTGAVSVPLVLAGGLWREMITKLGPFVYHEGRWYAIVSGTVPRGRISDLNSLPRK